MVPVGSGSVQVMTDPDLGGPKKHRYESGSTTLPVTICDAWYRHLYLFFTLEIIQWGGQKFQDWAKHLVMLLGFVYITCIQCIPLNRFLCTCAVLPSRDLLLTVGDFLPVEKHKFRIILKDKSGKKVWSYFLLCWPPVSFLYRIDVPWNIWQVIKFDTNILS